MKIWITGEQTHEHETPPYWDVWYKIDDAGDEKNLIIWQGSEATYESLKAAIRKHEEKAE